MNSHSQQNQPGPFCKWFEWISCLLERDTSEKIWKHVLDVSCLCKEKHAFHGFPGSNSLRPIGFWWFLIPNSGLFNSPWSSEPYFWELPLWLLDAIVSSFQERASAPSPSTLFRIFSSMTERLFLSACFTLLHFCRSLSISRANRWKQQQNSLSQDWIRATAWGCWWATPAALHAWVVTWLHQGSMGKRRENYDELTAPSPQMLSDNSARSS